MIQVQDLAAIVVKTNAAAAVDVVKWLVEIWPRVQVAAFSELDCYCDCSET